MDSPLTSKLRFLNPGGIPQGTPTEWTPALVQVRVPADRWGEVRLWRQGEPLSVYLKRLGEQVLVLADWPRSSAGHYRLRLEGPDWNEEQTLTIQPAKISRTAYSRLLEDLETRLPVAVALGLQQTGALSGIHFRPPSDATVAEELVRLQRAVLGTDDRPGLARVLTELARDPHKTLETTELWVPRDRARRPHPARLPQSLSLSGNLVTDGWPERVVDSRVEHTVDVYENRLVKAYFHQVHLRLRRLIRMLEASPLSEAPKHKQLLDKLLSARWQASFLDKVRLPTHLPTRLTMVLLKRPPYRAALEGYLEFRRSTTVRLEEPNLDAPLENLPRLYQTWGTLQVLTAVLEVAGELGYQLRWQRLVGRDAGGFFVRVFPDGKPVLLLAHPEHQTVVKLVPERTYGRGGSLHSISYSQRPDVAVEVQSPNSPSTVYLFDPKYKLEGELLNGESADGKPKKVDIDKMHAYRDAIRDEEGRRAVRYAAILYPGPKTHYNEGLEALRAYPGAETDLQKRIMSLAREALGFTKSQ